MTDNIVICLVGIVVLLVLIFARMWVGPALIVVSIVGIAIMKDWKFAVTALSPIPYSSIASYTFACIPLFVMMGCAIANTGIGADLYRFARNMLGKIKGGLAMATVAACGIFAAICSDSVTSAVVMSKVAYPEMRRNNYSEGLAAASITAGGTIGIMIPPSVMFILYGMLTESSIGALFAAGMIPGLTQILIYIVTVYIVCKIDPKKSGEVIHITREEKRKSILPVWPIIVIFAVMMGGIYGGFFTPVEAGAFGTMSVFVIALSLKRMNKKVTSNIVRDTVQTAGMVVLLIIGAYFFTTFMAVSGFTSYLSDALIGWQTANDIPRLTVIIVILAFFLITGLFLDCLAVLLLTLGIVFPIVVALGYHPIWWGVIMVRMLEISMVTPPYGLNLFVVARSCNVPIGKIYRGVLPFCAADLGHLVLLVAVPELSLWMPRLMGIIQ